MKTIIKSTMVLLLLGATVVVTRAQGADGSPPGDGTRGHHRPPPLISTLDANHDGVIDANEIANASAALKTLDKNSDGQLTRDELMPPRPEGTNNTANADRPHWREGKDGHRPAMPLMGALEANHDGVIDASEIANAGVALKTLDKNGDGQLTRDELMPHRPYHGDNGSGEGGPPADQDK